MSFDFLGGVVVDGRLEHQIPGKKSEMHRTYDTTRDIRQSASIIIQGEVMGMSEVLLTLAVERVCSLESGRLVAM